MPSDADKKMETVNVPIGPDQLAGTAPFGKDALILPAYVIIRLHSWMVSRRSSTDRLSKLNQPYYEIVKCKYQANSAASFVSLHPRTRLAGVSSERT